ncbi:MAG: CBS domain-containing protein [Gemmatimonadota bacterium]
MTTVSDIMQHELITVEASMTLREAVEVLRNGGVSGAPVLRGSRLVGVLSGTDLLEFEATSPGVPPERSERRDWDEAGGRPDEDEEENPSAFFFGRWEDSGGDVWDRVTGPDTPEWDVFEQHTVDEIMSRDLVTVSAKTPLAEAARRMLDRRVHRVLVVEGDELVGLMSAFDFVKLAADRS